jgi:hypothetical protein
LILEVGSILNVWFYIFEDEMDLGKVGKDLPLLDA